MPKRIDQLDNRTPLNDDWVVSTITNGIAGRSRLYQLVRNGLDQSVDTGGNSLSIIGPQRTSSGVGGHILLTPGKKAGGPSGDYSDYWGRVYLVTSNPSPTNEDTYFAFDDEKVTLSAGEAGVGRSLLLQSGTSTICTIHIGDSIETGPAITVSGPTIFDGLVIGGSATITSTKNGLYSRDFSAFDVVNAKLLWPRKVTTLSGAFSGSPDLGLDRAGVGILRITDGSSGGGSFSSPSSTFSLSAATNNLAVGSASHLRINPSGSVDLTGLSPTGSGHIDGRQLSLFNVGSGTLTLKHLSGLSSSGNRLYTQIGSDLAVAPGRSAQMTYDATSGYFRVSGGTSGVDSAAGPSGSLQYSSSGVLAGASGVSTNGSDLFVQGKFLSGSTYGRCGLYVLSKVTLSATTEPLTTDGQALNSDNQIVLPNNSTYLFDILISAQREDVVGERAAFRFEGVAFRNTGAGTVDILIGGVSKTTVSRSSVPWDVVVESDVVRGAMSVRATGETGKTIRWVAAVKTVEVQNAT
jgi:hypothetical protein